MLQPLLITLLDSFYTSSPRHWGTLAPLWWYPGDSSVSSRNLLKMCPSGWDILCINSCPTIQASANHHGRPEPLYVAALLRDLDNLVRPDSRRGFDLLLVCGSIAKATFRGSPYKGANPILFIHHPAWRAWSTDLFEQVRQQILTATMTLTSSA